MQNWKKQLRAIFTSPQQPLYQDQLRAELQRASQPAPTFVLEQYIDYIRETLTPEDWKRHGTQISFVKMTRIPSRIKPGQTQFRTVAQTRALVVTLPKGAAVGLTPDGRLHNLMPAFDSNAHGYYRTHQVVAVDKLSDGDARLIVQRLGELIQKIESES